MEIQKATKDLVYKWHDVEFTVRARATVEDRFEINVLYDVDTAGKVSVPRRDIYRTLIQRFVTGWTGVTEDGKPVPFSMGRLAQLPVIGTEDVILKLGSFIFNACGLLTSAEAAEKKKA